MIIYIVLGILAIVYYYLKVSIAWTVCTVIAASIWLITQADLSTSTGLESITTTMSQLYLFAAVQMILSGFNKANSTADNAKPFSSRAKDHIKSLMICAPFVLVPVIATIIYVQIVDTTKTIIVDQIKETEENHGSPGIQKFHCPKLFCNSNNSKIDIELLVVKIYDILETSIKKSIDDKTLKLDEYITGQVKNRGDSIAEFKTSIIASVDAEVTSVKNDINKNFSSLKSLHELTEIGPRCGLSITECASATVMIGLNKIYSSIKNSIQAAIISRINSTRDRLVGEINKISLGSSTDAELELKKLLYSESFELEGALKDIAEISAKSSLESIRTFFLVGQVLAFCTLMYLLSVLAKIYSSVHLRRNFEWKKAAQALKGTATTGMGVCTFEDITREEISTMGHTFGFQQLAQNSTWFLSYSRGNRPYLRGTLCFPYFFKFFFARLALQKMMFAKFKAGSAQLFGAFGPQGRKYIRVTLTGTSAVIFNLKNLVAFNDGIKFAPLLDENLTLALKQSVFLKTATGPGELILSFDDGNLSIMDSTKSYDPMDLVAFDAQCAFQVDSDTSTMGYYFDSYSIVCVNEKQALININKHTLQSNGSIIQSLGNFLRPV